MHKICNQHEDDPKRVWEWKIHLIKSTNTILITWYIVLLLNFLKNRGGKYKIGYLKKFERKYNKNIWLTLTLISLWNFDK